MKFNKCLNKKEDLGSLVSSTYSNSAAGTSKTYPIPFSGNSLISGNEFNDDL